MFTCLYYQIVTKNYLRHFAKAETDSLITRTSTQNKGPGQIYLIFLIYRIYLDILAKVYTQIFLEDTMKDSNLKLDFSACMYVDIFVCM